MTDDKAWTVPMPDAQFDLMRDILAAPSPIGLEGAMTFGVLEPLLASIALDGWDFHRFRGNAGIVLDTHPDRPEMLTMMVIGHADKIRMQVRSVDNDGKIWVNSDSFLPTTLIGHGVRLFSEDPKMPGAYRVIDGGTIEAIGAIHFASPEIRQGKAGIKPEMLYLELQVHGDKKKQQIEALGIRPGDPILLDRPIRRGFSPETFYGAYLDNGLGCFVATEAARLVASGGGLANLRVLFAMATHEEIGRFGSRVLAGELRPDIVVGVDVSHDLAAAPGVGDKRYTPVAMGKGCTLATGSITSAHLNAIFQRAAADRDIPIQLVPTGRDTGTDAMAGALAAIDAAATSIGFPIRNMHTISEIGHTGDVLAAAHLLAAGMHAIDAANEGTGMTVDDFRSGHPRLDDAAALAHIVPEEGDGDGAEADA